jgi:hypothetical protein
VLVVANVLSADQVVGLEGAVLDALVERGDLIEKRPLHR